MLISKKQNSTSQIFIIDGNSIICRFFYGMPERKSPDGINVNGLFGFIRFLLNFINENILSTEKPAKIIVCFDKARNNFRKNILPSYKQNRKTPCENFFHQIKLCEEMCEHFNIPVDYHNEYEADDLIATYCEKFSSDDSREIIVISNDKDLLQLVSDDKNIKLYNTAKKQYFNEYHVKNLMNVLPSQIPDLLAITGDASDNISGIFKIGPKTAVKLLEKYKNLENIIIFHKDPKFDFTTGRLFLKLTTLSKDAPLKHTNIDYYNLPYNKVIDYLERYNFKDLERYLYIK
jgi:DNA polymerase-1